MRLEVVRYELSEAERVCEYSHALHEASEDKDKSEQLEIIPTQIKVIEHVQVNAIFLKNVSALFYLNVVF